MSEELGLLFRYIVILSTHGERGLKVRDREEEVQEGQEESKWQRRSTGGKSRKSCK